MNKTTIIILITSVFIIISLLIYLAWPECAPCPARRNCSDCPWPDPIECSDCNPEECGGSKCKTCSMADDAIDTANLNYDLRIPKSQTDPKQGSDKLTCEELLTDPAGENPFVDPGTTPSYYIVTEDDIKNPSPILISFLTNCGLGSWETEEYQGGRPYDKIGISRQINDKGDVTQDKVNLLTSPTAVPTSPIPIPSLRILPLPSSPLLSPNPPHVKQNLCVVRRERDGKAANINWEDAAVAGLESVSNVDDFYEKYGTESSFATLFPFQVDNYSKQWENRPALDLVAAFDLRVGDKLKCAKREMDCEGLHKFVGNFNNPQKPCTEIQDCKCSESD